MTYRSLRWLPLGLLAVMVLLRVFEPPAIERARWAVFDSYQRLAPRDYEPATPVRIVDIDDESLAQIGQWPWPRTVTARLIQRLTEMGAASIALDIVLSEPDRSSPEQVLESWEDGPSKESLRALVQDRPSNDAVLAEAIGAGPVVTGFALVQKPSATLPRVVGTFVHAGDDPRLFVPSFAGAVTSLPALEQAAQGNGALNAGPDHDQVMRRVPLVLQADGKLYPALFLEAIRVALGGKSYLVKSSGASGIVSFGEHSGVSAVVVGPALVPTGPDARMLMRYTRSTPERYVSAWKLLDGQVPPQAIAGHIVLIGTSAAGLHDLRSTPVDTVVPGVEIHAQAVEQVLLGGYLERPDFAGGLELVYILVIGLILVFLLSRIGALWALLIGMATVTLAIAGSWIAYADYGWLLDPISPSLMVAVVYLSAAALSYLRAETERRQIRGAFSHYVSPAVVRQLASDPARLRLGGEVRTITVMFTDVRRFTAISEGYKDDPEGLTTLINRFLTPMTEVVMRHRGTVDKYIGDCLMSFWNAPLDDPGHAINACNAALDQHRALRALNDELSAEPHDRDGAGGEHGGREDAQPPITLRMGTGLSTGSCLVGNLGSAQRFDYSALGDAVNLASRLEAQTKVYGVPIIVAEETRRLAPSFAYVELDIIAVAGKTEPVTIFALLGDSAMAERPAFQRIATLCEEMLALYRARRWDEALGRVSDLEQAADAAPLAAFCRLYRARITQFAQSPPEPGWTGVHVALTK